MTSGQLEPPAGVYRWHATAADLGLDLDTAHMFGTFGELDALCRAAGVEGGTYATGVSAAQRSAYAVVDGRQYVAPAMWDPFGCCWPNPGEPVYHRGAREADHAENRATSRYHETGIVLP